MGVSHSNGPLGVVTEPHPGSGLAALFDRAALGMGFCSLEGRLERVNPRLCEIVGASADDLVGSLAGGLLDDVGRERARRVAMRLANGRDDSQTFAARVRRRDGSTLRCSVTLTVVRDDAGARSFAAIVEDRDDDVELLRMNRALKMVGGCSDLVVRASSEARLLEDVAGLIVEAGGYRAAWVGYAREDALRTIEPMAVAGAHGGYFERERIGWDASDPRGCGGAGMTIRSGTPTVVERIDTDRRYLPWRESAIEAGFHSNVVLPLRDETRTFGVLGLLSSDARAPAPAEVALLQELADNLAFGIGHLRAREDQRRLQLALEKISSAVSDKSGCELLVDLVANVADAVGAKAAFVVRPHPTEPLMYRTLVAVIEGERLPAIDFSSDGSPCNDVAADDFLIVERDLGDRYPNCDVNAVVGARAVIGAHIEHVGQGPPAKLMLLFREPLRDLDFLRASLRIFVARITSELERQATYARIEDQASWLDRARDAIVVRDIDGRIGFWNDGAMRLYGGSRDEACGQMLGERLFADVSRFREATAAVVRVGFWNGEAEVLRKDGTRGWVESHWTTMTDADGAPRSILSIDTDITARKASEREIEQLAFFDPLTTLPNRSSLVKSLKDRLARCERVGALVFLDLDNFKSLNDTLGHDQGDVLLRRVAARLRACVGPGDAVARFGGDEFVVVLHDLGATRAEAQGRGREIVQAMFASFHAPFALDGHVHACTASVGVTLYERGDRAEELLKQADLAMYRAKAAGRNAIAWFTPVMQALVSSRRALEMDLRDALDDGAFSLVYQPQFDVGRDVIGVEALVRWRHPTRGYVSPAEFIPVAEESGLIVPLGRLVLERACERLAAWAATPATASIKISVNVSAREFRQPDFVTRALAIVAAAGANPRKLVFELTESVFADDVDLMIEKMAALRATGIGFSLDDFGTGYSSLSYLRRLPFSQLKIDGSFVRDVLLDANDAVIARTIVGLGKSLSLDVIAEGVETQEQFAFLADAGCPSFQGYFFARPMPAEAFEAFVAERLVQTK